MTDIAKLLLGCSVDSMKGPAKLEWTQWPEKEVERRTSAKRKDCKPTANPQTFIIYTHSLDLKNVICELLFISDIFPHSAGSGGHNMTND